MKLLPVNIVAKRLGLSTESVYRMGRQKKLKIIALGPNKCFRVIEKDLTGLLKEMI